MAAERKHRRYLIAIGFAALLLVAGVIAVSVLYETGQRTAPPDKLNPISGTWRLQKYSGSGCAPYPPKQLEFEAGRTYRSRQDGGPVTSSGTYVVLADNRLKMTAAGSDGRINYIVQFAVRDAELVVTTQSCNATYHAVR